MASAAEQLAANLDVGAFQKATELHKRLLFTLGAMIVYRLGTYIPIPGIDPAAIANIIDRQQNGMLGMANLFSGGAVSRMAIFALNVMPYISASIIVQLLGTMYPPWEKLQEGRRRGGPQAAQPVHPLPDRDRWPSSRPAASPSRCSPARARCSTPDRSSSSRPW